MGHVKISFIYIKKIKIFITVLLHLLTYMKTEMQRYIKKSSKTQKVRHRLLKLQEFE